MKLKLTFTEKILEFFRTWYQWIILAILFSVVISILTTFEYKVELP